jgi:hypothetical protein
MKDTMEVACVNGYTIMAARIDRSDLINNRDIPGYEILLHPTQTAVYVHDYMMPKRYAQVASCEPSIKAEPRLAGIRYIYGGSIDVMTHNWADLYRLAACIGLSCLVDDLIGHAEELFMPQIVHDAFKHNLAPKHRFFAMLVHQSSTVSDAVEKVYPWVRKYTIMHDVAAVHTWDPFIDEVCFKLITYSEKCPRDDLDQLMKYRSFGWVTKDNLKDVLKYCSESSIIDALLKLRAIDK